MPYTSQSNARPARVTLENCPDKTIVRMTDNVTEQRVENQTVYEYDELKFILPSDRHETVKTIEDNFEDWWLYGCEDHEPPTIEERVTILEEIIMED